METNPIEDKVDGSHWTTVRDLWMKKDKEQCESWRDEVQNILIFSGLFSAVVTAFVIESQKALQPDFAEESVQLLRKIAGVGDQISGKSRVDQGAMTISINVFWFLSLVLSLTAALIGIIALQWIRTHLQSLSYGSESLGISHMHSLGLEKSHIPQIFASLPIILIFALALFLIGLVVFLFQLTWHVATPVAIAIAFTFLFVLITTFLPGLQSPPAVLQHTTEPNSFPSPYRSPQSLLFLQVIAFLKQFWQTIHRPMAIIRDPELNLAAHEEERDNLDLGRDWTFRSQIWFRRRQNVSYNNLPGHLEVKWDSIDDDEMKPFPYDVVQALISVKKRRIAETEKERTALARCLAQVLPIHLSELFQPETKNRDLAERLDLADLIPFLSPSNYFPSSLIMHDDSATRADLNAVALLQVATCNGRPKINSALVKACVLSTHWLFEKPRTFYSPQDSQPLNLISDKFDKFVTEDLEVLIATLIGFFNFAPKFQPDIEITKIANDTTTHTSSYTYFFLVTSATILAHQSFSSSSRLNEMQNRHAYMLDRITIHLREKKESNDYLFYTAFIYGSKISAAKASLTNWDDFAIALNSYREYLKARNPEYQNSPLYKVLRVNDVAWNNISSRLSSG